MSEPSEIVFFATVYKVQTLVDNGIRLTLDLPEWAIPEMALLAECQRGGMVLSFTAREREPEASTNRLKGL